MIISAKGQAVDNRPYALIAGGSKGIGYSIAEALGKRGYNLVLVARHLDALQHAKQSLELKYGIHVEILVNDLSREQSAIEITNWCNEKNLPLKMLCNVAGAGGSRDYLYLPLDSLRYMIRLNIESTMALTHSLLPLLGEKRTIIYFKRGEYGGICSNSAEEYVFCHQIGGDFLQLLTQLPIERKRY